ncbi:MAG: biosynthetic-type acetolactate synthase large subunit [Candidatus Methanomethylicia archaeon]
MQSLSEIPINAAHGLVKSMEEFNVKIVFGIPGGAVLPFFDYLYDSNIRFILVRHEQAAVHAADAYGRVTGTPGVVVATSGPGATNLITGLATAYMDSSPLVAITGQVSRDMIGRDAFQEADITGLAMPVTKQVFLADDAETVPSLFKLSYRLSSHLRPGPILIDIPKDLWLQPIKQVRNVEFIVKRISEPDLNLVMEATSILLKAEKPVILVGGGVAISGVWNDVLSLAEALNAPIVTTLMGKNSIPSIHPLVMGVAGMHGRPEANIALLESDVVLVVGARLSDRTVSNFNSFRSGRKIIHLDIDASEIGKNIKPDLSIVGDLHKSISEMVKLVLSNTVRRSGFISRLYEVRRRFEEYLDSHSEPCFKPWKALKIIRQSIPSNSIITTGVGQNQMWTSLHWTVFSPRTYITSGGLGTMGFGLPAAIGVKAAFPDRVVLDIDGDGSLLMTCQNLAVISEENLPVIVVVFDNRALGMIRQWQSVMFRRRYIASDIGCKTDFLKLAESFGIDGVSPKTYSELEHVIRRYADLNEPLLVDLTIDTDELVLPFVPPGKCLSEMIMPEGVDVNVW